MPVGDRNAILTFPARLAELRQTRGWTQKQLADVTGTSIFSVRKLEQGRRFPSLELAGRLADSLGVTIDSLLKPAGTR